MPSPNQDISQLKENLYKSPLKSKNSTFYRAGIIIAVIISLFVIAGSIFRVLTPPQTPIYQTNLTLENKNFTKTKFTSIQYTGDQIDIPEKFAIAKPTLDTQTSEDITLALVEQFDLDPVPELEQYWQNSAYKLYKDPDLELFLFLKNVELTGNKTQPPFLQKDQAISDASNFVRQILPSVELTPQVTATQPIELTDEFTVTTEDKANAYQVPFSPSINGFPVFYKKEAQFAFMVLVDGNNELQRIEFNPLFKKYAPAEEKNSISLEQAIKNIQAGTGSIIDVTFIDSELSLADLQGAEFKSVSIEYREDPIQNIAYPFFRFAGPATTADGTTAEIQVITPAITTTRVN